MTMAWEGLVTDKQKQQLLELRELWTDKRSFDRLTANVASVSNLLIKSDADWCHINVGRERVGKSTLGAWMYLIASIVMNADTTADRVVFELSDWNKQIYETQDTPVMPDEGAFLFSANEAMTKEVREAQKDLTGIGMLHHFLIIQIPNFKILIPYIRNHRVDSLFWVPKRGRAWLYTQNLIKRIPQNSDTKEFKYSDIDPAMKINFPNMDNRHGFWAEYKAKKGEWRDKRKRKKEAKAYTEMTSEERAADLYAIIQSTDKMWDLYVRKYRGRSIVLLPLIEDKYSIGRQRALRVKKLVECKLEDAKRKTS